MKKKGMRNEIVEDIFKTKTKQTKHINLGSETLRVLNESMQ